MKKQKQETKDLMVDEQSQSSSDFPSRIEAPSSFDIKEYEKQFSGIGKISRLLHIADKCPEHSLQAFQLAIQEAKKSLNTKLYQELYMKALEKYQNIGIEFDDKWVAQANKKYNERLNTLEATLVRARKEGEREDCAAALLDLASWYLERGDYQNALSKCVEAREFAPPSSVTLHLLTIRAALPINSHSHVKSSATRLKLLVDAKDQPSSQKQLLAQANAVLGLVFLKTGFYFNACQHFLQVTSDLGSSLNEIIAPTEIGLYGLLTSFASLPRQEFQRYVLNNNEFRRFLDFCPSLKNLASDFYQAKFASFFKTFQESMNGFYLDVHLYSKLASLLHLIREHALVIFTKPYSHIHFSSLAEALQINEQQVELLLFQSINNKQITARLDTFNKMMISNNNQQQRAAQQHALVVGDHFLLRSRCLLLRLSMLETGTTIKWDVSLLSNNKKTTTASTGLSSLLNSLQKTQQQQQQEQQQQPPAAQQEQPPVSSLDVMEE